MGHSLSVNLHLNLKTSNIQNIKILAQNCLKDCNSFHERLGGGGGGGGGGDNF